MEITKEALQAIREEIRRTGIQQQHVAEKLGMAPFTLSRILSGQSPAPAGFKVDCQDAIHIVQAAQAAAQEAFARAMGRANG